MPHAVQGIYLLLEKLKQPTYRRLFKRVQLLHAQQQPAKAVQVPLGAPAALYTLFPAGASFFMQECSLYSCGGADRGCSMPPCRAFGAS